MYVYFMTGAPEGSAECIVNQWFTFYYLDCCCQLLCPTSYFVGLLGDKNRFVFRMKF